MPNVDPFVELIRLLKPQSTGWRRIEAAGRWGVSFHKRDDLLFCYIADGECKLLRPGRAAVKLMPGDFALIRTVTPFSFASDAKAKCMDSETAFRPSLRTLKVGAGRTNRVVLNGGRFFFDEANEALLTGLLPPLVHISAGDKDAWRVRSLLTMNAAESQKPGPGSAFVMTRLMELVLVEILRTQAARVGGASESEAGGMLAGLADPVLWVALHAMHGRVAHGWTVGELARLAGVSRSAFATRFSAVVGMGPIDYLLNWRMAIAKESLRAGEQTLSEIAFAIGFHSASAFSTAFRRSAGCSPGRYAASLR